jgi:methyl-accepting chemotaxis protein
MKKFIETIVKAKIPIIIGIALIIIVGSALWAIPLHFTSLSNISKTAKLQCQEAGAILSMKINTSADIIRNHAFLIAHLVETDLVAKEKKRALILSELEIKYKKEKALNNLWCTFEPNALDGMDAHYINRVGSNNLGIFVPWFIDDQLTVDQTAEDYESSFYTIPKDTRQEAVSDPYWDTVNGKRILMITFTAPILLNDTFLGVLGTDFYIDDLNELVDAPKLAGNGKLVTDKKIIVIHDNAELIGKHDDIDYDAIINKLTEQELIDEFFTSEGRAMYRVYVPVSTGKIGKPWLYIIEVPAKQIYAEVRTTVALLSIIFVLFVLSVYFFIKTVEQNRKLKDLNRIKDKLFSVVAHDLRGPIGSLVSMMELLTLKMTDAETQIRLLKDISHSVNDVYGLLDNLLRWAKSQMQGMVLSPAHFDVQSEVRKITDTLQDTAASK